MNSYLERFTSTILSAIILLSMVLSLVLPAGGNHFAQAQEVTAEPPVDSPEQAPPPVELPEAEATAEATPQVDAPPVIPTDNPVTDPVVVPPIVETTSYMDDFQDGDTNGWALSAGWILSSTPADGNVYLMTNGSFETATVPGFSWADVAVSARLGITPGNTANVAVRVGADNYNVTFRADGSVSLFQGMTPLTETVATATIAEGDILPRWFAVNIQAVGNVITITVDGTPIINFTAPVALPAGSVIFSSGVNNTGAVMIDDVNLSQIAGSPVVVPVVTEDAPVIVDVPPQETPTEEAPVVVVDPVVEATEEIVVDPVETTPEATTEVETTAEATANIEVTETVEIVEPTPEATTEVETTPEAEITAEATTEVEVTAEATAEVTAEATPEAETTPEPESVEDPSADDATIFTDFEGEISGWAFSEGASVVITETGAVLAMSADAILQPEPAVFLTDLQLDLLVNITPEQDSVTQQSDDAEATPEVVVDAPDDGNVNITFRSGENSAYHLRVGVDNITLYRSNIEGETPLASAPLTLSTGTWYAISLNATGGEITVNVDDANVMSFSDEAPIAGGEVAITALSAVSVDDVALTDLSVAGDGAETAVPYALDDEDMVKVGNALFGVLQTYIDEGEAAAVAAAETFFIPLDDSNRVRVVLWATAESSPDAISEIATVAGAEIILTDAEKVDAYATFDVLIDLINRDEIAAISFPVRVVSTAATTTIPQSETNIEPQALGDNINPHSLDIIGAKSWHDAGIYGAGVTIGVIDTSFSGINTASAEQTCITANPTPITQVGDVGDPGTGHGVNVIEVICDVAPQATIRMYRASSRPVIDDAINRAVNDLVDLIVITIDGGDSVGGANGDIQGAISTAYVSNIPVIASAGNSGDDGATIFSFPGGENTATIRTSAGSIIDYSWVDTNGTENYPSTLSQNGDVVDSRMVRAGSASHQYVVPQSCGESCDVTLTVDGSTATTMQIQAAGGVDDIVTSSSMTRSNVADTLTTAASSANAIAVGAVCSTQTNSVDDSRYPILPDSSIGANGQAANGNIKPEVVAPSYVETSRFTGEPFCHPTNTGSSDGFGGTSAAASHVAGMAALLMTTNNPVNAVMDDYFNNTFQRPQRLEQYLMGHATDLGAIGFDNIYGSGLTVLGNPNFAVNQQLNYVGFANPDGLNPLDSEAYYVGNSNLSTGQDGSPSNPYFHITTAINAAIAAGREYVIVQPGEYVGGFEIPDPTGTNNLTLISYDNADFVNRFDTAIHVTDAFNPSTGGGIYINDSQNVTVQGFDFSGATMNYSTTTTDLLVVPPAPIYVDGSGTSDNISILENNFDNFDQPLVVNNTDSTTVTDNVFNDFDIRFTLIGATATSLDRVAALSIVGDTNVGNVQTAVVERNAFTNSFIRQTTGQNRYNSLVLVNRVEADLWANRFENNEASAMITIDHWITEDPDPVSNPNTRVNYEVNVYSSLFNNNTMMGPIINLYQGSQFRFVNNSVVNHDMDQLGVTTGSIIGVGGANSNFVQMSNHRWNIENNLFFNNLLAGSLIASINNSEGAGSIDLGCDAIGSAPNAGDGVQFNWFMDRFDNLGASVEGGECSQAQIEAPSNNNFFGKNFVDGANIGSVDWLVLEDSQTFTDFESSTFFMTFDPGNPYRLLPYDVINPPDPIPTTPPNGVDIQNNGIVNTILGFDIQTADPNDPPLDVMGLPRLIDRTNLNDMNTSNDYIDIGAYELSDPQPVSFIADDGSLTPLTSEDSDAITFRIDDRVEGGFRPYSFNFSNLPVLYDGNSLNPCEGEPILYDEATNEVTYCPPKDFHTTGADTPDITFNYTATGILDTGTTPLGTVTITIDPVDDGRPVAYDDPEGDTQVIFTDLSSPVSYRLEPYVDFSPVFALSDPDDDDSPATPSDADYPFALSNFTVDTGASGHEPLLFDLGSSPSQGQMNTAISSAVTDGTFNFTPAPGISGAIEFTYNVQDQDGDNATKRVRMVVTTRLAGPGLHDETSLDFVYQDSWLPYYFPGAINDTIHYTSADTSVDFYFIGDAFGVYFYGAPGYGNLELTLDPDDTGPLTPESYNTFNELTCSDPTKPAQVPTARATAGYYLYGCEGLDDISGAKDQLRRLTISNATPGFFIILDAVTVRGDGLPAGEYNDSDFQIDYSPTYDIATNPTGWLTGIASPSAFGATLSYTSAQNATMTFDVDGDDVDTLVVYYTMGLAWSSFDIYVNGALRKTVDTNSATTLFGQSAVVTGIGSGINTVQIRNRSNAFLVVEGIELIQAESALTAGSYDADDSRVSYIGNWVDYAGVGPEDGTLRYSADLNATAVFRIDGNGVTVNRTMATGWGQMEVCIGLNNCTTFGGDAAVTLWSEPATVRSSISGIQTVTVRSLDIGVIGIDTIEVINATEGMGPGYYEEDDPNLAYQGTWTPWIVPQVLGGTAVYSNDLDAVITFSVNASLIDEIAIYYPGGVGWGGMRVCNGNSCQSINLNIAPLAYNNIQRIPKALLNLNNETNATITIQSNGGFMGVEAIQLIPPAGSLTAGYYEETEQSTGFNLTYTGGWVPFAGVGPRGGSMRYTNSTSESATFSVVPNDIDGIVIYHTGGLGYGGLSVCNGLDCDVIPNPTPTVASFGNRTFIPKADLNLPASNDASSITIRPETNGLYIGLEALHIVSADPDTAVPNFGELTSGINAPDSDSFLYAGTWINYQDAVNIPSGVWEYSSDQTSAVFFVVDGPGIVINHGASSTYGNIEVCIDGDECRVLSTYDEIFKWKSSTSVWFDNPGVHSVEIRSIDVNLVAIESIEALTGSQPELVTETYYEETVQELNYSGLWYPLTSVGSAGGTLEYGLTSATNNPQVSFEVDTTNLDAIVIYHPISPGWGTMVICRNQNDDCQTITLNNVLAQNGVTTRISTASLNLAAGTETVTIRAQTGYAAIEAIQLVRTQALAPGYYEETPQSTGFNLEYTAGWLSLETIGPRGGNMRYTSNIADTATFDVIPNNIDGIVVYHTGGVGYGGMNVCNGGTCVLISNPTPAIASYGNRTYIPKANLGLGTGTGEVEIAIRPETNGLFIGLEALHIIGGGSSLPLLPDGRNSADSDNLEYIGNWIDYAAPTGPLGGVLSYSSEQAASVMFRINGDGITLYRTLALGWGAFEVCIDGNQCEIFTNNAATTVWAQPVTVRADSGVGEHVVEIRSLDIGVIGIETIEVIEPASALTPTAIYHELDPNLTYTNTVSAGLVDWTPLYTPTATGGSAIYTNDPADTLTFNVDAVQATELIIYHAGSVGWGTMQVCSAGNADCVTRNTATSPMAYGNEWVINISNGGGVDDLDLTGANAQVTINALSGFIGVESIGILGATEPLTPGMYEESDLNLAYTGTWIDLPGLTYSGGQTVYTTQNGAAVSFSITDTTGFTIFYSRFATGVSADMRICYTRQSNGDTNCNAGSDGVVSTVSPTGVTQDFYGYSVFGLPHRNVSDTADETYNVTISHNSPASPLTYLILDSIYVLGDHDGPTLTSTTPGSPNGQPVLYDANTENVTYGPEVTWLSGVLAGYIGETYHYSTYSGATAQATIEGNQVTVYQTVYPSGSLDVQFCVVQAGGNLSSNLQCTDFAQLNATTVVGAPIALYGFGYDERDIVFQNRSYGLGFFLDGLEVR